MGTSPLSPFAHVILSPARGDPVPGSRLYRNRCCQCGDAIRVRLRDRLATDVQCDGCRRLSRSGVPRLARARLH